MGFFYCVWLFLHGYLQIPVARHALHGAYRTVKYNGADKAPRAGEAAYHNMTFRQSYSKQERWKTGHVKKRFQAGKNENWFSARSPHMGAKKKYKAHISKYV